ncbi:MAG: disulfide bond formation protein B [Terricaulis sp.]|nr:disulfide bond formation protein B [Terricaulis sp.]
MPPISRLRLYWPFIAGFVSAALLAGAHAFQRFGGLAPCPLCLDQREWHWGVLAAAALGAVILRFKPQWARWVAAGLGAVFLGSVAQAAFHVAVEQAWIIHQCAADPNLDNLRFDINAVLTTPQCDKIAWSLGGISMAGYNAIISLIMALASFAIALLPERKA